jgi:hypothetical protein
MKFNIGDWVSLNSQAHIDGFSFASCGKVVGITGENCDVQFALSRHLIQSYLLQQEKKFSCLPENVAQFLDWFKNRGGIAVWLSADLSDPGRTYFRPYLTKDGKPMEKSAQLHAMLALLTDSADMDVVTYKEIKRFHVATRLGANGLKVKVTSGGTNRIRKAVAKAAKEYGDATFTFDYMDYNNAVILVPENPTPLSEWEVGQEIKSQAQA